METASMMTALPSMEARPIDDWKNGLSETVSASVVSLDYVRCYRSGIFASVRKLEENWDGHGAHAPCRHSMDLTHRLWSYLNKKFQDLPLPEVMATSEGGVYLEWDTPNAELIVEFDPAGKADIFAKTADFEVDGSLKDHSREFWLTLSAL
jgi:hypothetical protein